MVIRGKKGIYKTKTPFAGSVAVNSSTPVTVADALSDPTWFKAMTTEFGAIQKNGTWSLFPATKDMHIVGSKWIFKIKYKADGTIERHKAWLVAQGFTQTLRLDFFYTFSPVIKPSTVRIVLSIAATFDWAVHQLDVHNAFLNGTLQETVYMSQPPGFEDKEKPHYMCKLHKALFGLKQGPRAWFDKLRTTLLLWGFLFSKADPSLFYFVSFSTVILILIYVDDIIVIANKPQFLSKFTQKLHRSFALRDLRPLHFFFEFRLLGIRMSSFYLSLSMHLIYSQNSL